MPQQGWTPIDALGSPVYGLLDTVSQFPYLRDTQFQNWLEDSWSGASNFRAEQPGWATALDIGSSFVPFIGWGGALNKAAAAGRTAGLLGATNRAGQAAAGLARGSPGLAFALGETVRYAPPALAMSAVDTLGQRYDSPTDALGGLVAGTALGVGLGWAGHALSPLVQRAAPEWLGQGWKAAFEPSPELQTLYGFSGNVQRAGVQAARNPRVQDAALQPEPQQRAALWWQLRQDVEAAHAAQATGQPVTDPRLLEIDPKVAAAQYDVEVRNILGRELGPTESGFRAPDLPLASRTAIESLTRPGPNVNGTRIRLQLTGVGDSATNNEAIAKRLELPEGWIHSSELPGITKVAIGDGNGLSRFLRQSGLADERPAPEYRQLIRTTPSGSEQKWSVIQETDDGLYLLTTELPPQGLEIQRMTERSKFKSTAKLDPNDPARVFFSVKTHEPWRFFPHMLTAFDSPNPGMIGNFRSRIPKGTSTLLDRLMDFEDVYLNPSTIRAAQRARTAGKGGRQKITEEILGGPTAGKQIAQWFDTYTSPGKDQLKRSPLGRALMGFHQAAFDAAEGRARALLHGTASIPEGKSAIASLFSEAVVDEAGAVTPALRRLIRDDPGALEVIRQFDNGTVDIKSLEGTPVGKWLMQAMSVNDTDLAVYNGAVEGLRKIGATDARTIKYRARHFGISRKWDGSIAVPIYAEGGVHPVAMRAGHSLQEAQRKAREWIAHFEPIEGKGYREGTPYVPSEGLDPPEWFKPIAITPGFLEPRTNLRGFEHEFEPYKHVDDLIARLESGYVARGRYAAATIADAMTVGKMNLLRARDPNAFMIVNTRLNQLKSVAGPFDEFQNRVIDTMFQHRLGVKGATKIAEAVNKLMFHTLHGVGQIATPVLNLTSFVQTELPAGIEFLSARPEQLVEAGFWLPKFGEDGLPSTGVNWVADPLGLMWGGVKKTTTDDPEVKEIFNVLFNDKIMGGGLANEYTGQDRTIVARASEGIRSADDIGYWAERGSSLMMQKTEQITRTWAAGMALKAMDMWENMHPQAPKFTTAQKIHNAKRFVLHTNYGYHTADRPMMYTTPLGSLFGNQKTWMTNYLFMQAHYLGLAGKGNIAPLLFSMGATAMLGGTLAVPLLGQGIDVITRTFEGKDATEYMFEHFGQGGNAISFGLPALFGVSIQGNVSGPGANLAHDTEFMFSIVALERAKLLGRAIGRGWDDQVTLGMNPFRDELFRKQITQAIAPRAMYRAMESLMDQTLRSSATGYPMVREFGIGSRILHSMGFRETDIAVQYAAYENLLRDRDGMRHRVAVLGDAYARASLEGNRAEMLRLLQTATVQGVDVNRVMQSSQVRIRNAGYDMFGRNMNQEMLDNYQATLEQSRGSSRKDGR